MFLTNSLVPYQVTTCAVSKGTVCFFLSASSTVPRFGNWGAQFDTQYRQDWIRWEGVARSHGEIALFTPVHSAEQRCQGVRVPGQSLSESPLSSFDNESQ